MTPLELMRSAALDEYERVDDVFWHRDSETHFVPPTETLDGQLQDRPEPRGERLVPHRPGPLARPIVLVRRFLDQSRRSLVDVGSPAVCPFCREFSTRPT